MSRPTLRQLSYELFLAIRQVPIGSYWRHQASGDVYEVVSLAIRESDYAPIIQYRPTKHDAEKEKCGFCERPASELIFDRPLSEFMEEVEWEAEGLKWQGTRFQRVHKVEHWVDG